MKLSEEEQALATLLRSGRADPSGEDLERLERRLSPWLGAPPSAGHGGGGATWKAALFLVALGLFSPSDVMHSAPPPSAPVGATSVASSVAEALASEVHDAPVLAPSSEATVSVLDLPNAPAAVAARATPAPPRSNAPAPPAPAAPAGVAEPEGAPAQVADTSARETESEASFLRRAQTTLSGDPAAALTMLDAHPARFPQGVLVQERDVMAIDALARLGRMGEARARARAFAARYPRSAHESRITSILKEGTP